MQDPCYNHCRTRDRVSGSAGIRLCTSRIVGQCVVEVSYGSHCGPFREHYRILFFFRKKLGVEALNRPQRQTVGALLKARAVCCRRVVTSGVRLSSLLEFAAAQAVAPVPLLLINWL